MHSHLSNYFLQNFCGAQLLYMPIKFSLYVYREFKLRNSSLNFILGTLFRVLYEFDRQRIDSFLVHPK